jgi:Ser/Thr protein kinase RdoA (MazF antagonist)
VHPDLAEPLHRILETTAETRRAMVHGDISPKNIIVSAEGPIFLDAECAWYGDPAFDLAFCLNHLLLKCLWVPRHRDRYLACFKALVEAYCVHVSWEGGHRLEQRAARLLPGLLLARADGKSPAEYLTEVDKELIRKVATGWLRCPVERLSDIHVAWAAEITR